MCVQSLGTDFGGKRNDIKEQNNLFGEWTVEWESSAPVDKRSEIPWKEPMKAKDSWRLLEQW